MAGWHLLVEVCTQPEAQPASPVNDQNHWELCSVPSSDCKKPRRIHLFLNKEVAEDLVQVLVILCLEISTSLLACVLVCVIQSLQLIQNAAALLVFNLPLLSHNMPLLHTALATAGCSDPVQDTYQTLNGSDPSFIQDMVKLYTQACPLCSTTANWLAIPSLGLQWNGSKHKLLWIKASVNKCNARNETNTTNATTATATRISINHQPTSKGALSSTLNDWISVCTVQDTFSSLTVNWRGYTLSGLWKSMSRNIFIAWLKKNLRGRNRKLGTIRTMLPGASKGTYGNGWGCPE